MAKVRYTNEDVIEIANGIIAENGGKMTYGALYERVSTTNPVVLPLLGKVLAAGSVRKRLVADADGKSTLYVMTPEFVEA